MLIYANLALCIWFCPTDPDVCLRIPLSCFWNTSPGFWGPGPWCVNQTLLQVATPQVEKLQGRGEIQSQTNQSFQWSGTCVCLLAHGRTFVTVVYPINIYIMKYPSISRRFRGKWWSLGITGVQGPGPTYVAMDSLLGLLGLRATACLRQLTGRRWNWAIKSYWSLLKTWLETSQFPNLPTSLMSTGADP